MRCQLSRIEEGLCFVRVALTLKGRCNASDAAKVASASGASWAAPIRGWALLDILMVGGQLEPEMGGEWLEAQARGASQ